MFVRQTFTYFHAYERDRFVFFFRRFCLSSLRRVCIQAFIVLNWRTWSEKWHICGQRRNPGTKCGGRPVQEVWGTEVPQWGPGAKPR